VEEINHEEVVPTRKTPMIALREMKDDKEDKIIDKAAKY
jgi:hypothetical protein